MQIFTHGQRIVVFDRDANDPKVTSDWPINDLARVPTGISFWLSPPKNWIYLGKL
jgi:hypothetical protein